MHRCWHIFMQRNAVEVHDDECYFAGWAFLTGNWPQYYKRSFKHVSLNRHVQLSGLSNTCDCVLNVSQHKQKHIFGEQRRTFFFIYLTGSTKPVPPWIASCSRSTSTHQADRGGSGLTGAGAPLSVQSMWFCGERYTLPSVCGFPLSPSPSLSPYPTHFPPYFSLSSRLDSIKEEHFFPPFYWCFLYKHIIIECVTPPSCLLKFIK